MITKKFDYTECPRETIDGRRHYVLPNGDRVASVTTILDATRSEEKTQALAAWRKAVGVAKATEITTEAAARGTRMHSYLESYIKTDDFKPYPTNPYAQASWFMAAQVIMQGLVHVDEYWGCEVPVYYTGLYAGTTDCVGLWKGKPAIIDFKQTNKPKNRDWIDDYFIQLAAYAAAHNHVHGTEIQTGVILMCVQPGKDAQGEFTTPEFQLFEINAQEFDHWSDCWNKRVSLYYQGS